MNEIRPVGTEKYEFEFEVESNLLAFLDFSEYHSSVERKKTNKFLVHWLKTTLKLPVGASIREIKPALF